MKNLLIIIIFIVFSNSLKSQVPFEYECLPYKSEILGQDVSYSIILPSDYYISKKEYPVVYFFHGIGGDCSTWLEYGHLASVMNKMVNSGKIDPFIMVIPSGFLSYYCNTYDGKFNYESFLMKELYPYIEKNYRTKTSNKYHAIVGFSMGGFGSLTIALRYPEQYGSVVALSPSIRTDSQYMEEGPQDGWDDQWGRIFGGKGALGAKRLTTYYKKNSPSHIIADCKNISELDDKIYLDVGDKENSLCRSNEELHRLLSEKGIKHYWTVRGGNHDFDVWCAALPNAFRYLNSRFSNTPFFVEHDNQNYDSNIKFDKISDNFSDDYYPLGVIGSKRKYPIIYISGANDITKETALNTLSAMINEGKMPYVILSFIKKPIFSCLDIKSHEAINYSIRGQQRMRAMIALTETSSSSLSLLQEDNLFTAHVLANPQKNGINALDIEKWMLAYQRYPRLWIDMDSDSQIYNGFSDLHIFFRENKVEHEFRSRISWDLNNYWQEWFEFIIKRIYV